MPKEPVSFAVYWDQELELDKKKSERLALLKSGESKELHLKKLNNVGLYRGRIGKDRLLFKKVTINKKEAFVLIDILTDHNYNKYFANFKNNALNHDQIELKTEEDLQEKEITIPIEKFQKKKYVKFNKGKYIKLDKKQKISVKQLPSILPHIYIGQPGSGKTLVIEESIKEVLAQNVFEEIYFLFPIESPVISTVSKEVKSYCEKHNLKNKLTAISYQKLFFALYPELSVKKVVGANHFKEVFEYSKAKANKDSKGYSADIHAAIDLDPTLVSDRLYAELVRNSLREGKQEPGKQNQLIINDEINTLIPKIFEFYTDYLASNQLIDLALTLPKEIVPIENALFYIDETQNLSPCQLQFLNHLSSSSIAYFEDPYQGQDSVSKLRILCHEIYNGIPIDITVLEKSYRLPYYHQKMINYYYNLIFSFVGAIEKHYKPGKDDSKIMNANEGIVDWQETCPDLRERANSSEFAIVVMDEVDKKKFKDDFIALHKINEQEKKVDFPLLFSAAEIGGQEYDTVVLYCPFSLLPKEFYIPDNVDNYSNNRARDKIDNFTAILFKLLTLCSRARKELLIIGDKGYFRGVQALINKLKEITKKDEVKLKNERQSPAKIEIDLKLWEKKAEEMEQLGLVEQAKDIRKKFNLPEFKNVLIKDEVKVQAPPIKKEEKISSVQNKKNPPQKVTETLQSQIIKHVRNLIDNDKNKHIGSAKFILANWSKEVEEVLKEEDAQQIPAICYVVFNTIELKDNYIQDHRHKLMQMFAEYKNSENKLCMALGRMTPERYRATLAYYQSLILPNNLNMNSTFFLFHLWKYVVQLNSLPSAYMPSLRIFNKTGLYKKMYIQGMTLFHYALAFDEKNLFDALLNNIDTQVLGNNEVAKIEEVNKTFCCLKVKKQSISVGYVETQEKIKLIAELPTENYDIENYTQSITQPLFKPILIDHFRKIRKYNEILDLNLVDKDGYSPLHRLLYSEKLWSNEKDFVLSRALRMIHLGANYNALDKEGNTPLGILCQKGCFMLVTQILKLAAWKRENLNLVYLLNCAKDQKAIRQLLLSSNPKRIYQFFEELVAAKNYEFLEDIIEEFPKLIEQFCVELVILPNQKVALFANHQRLSNSDLFFSPVKITCSFFMAAVATDNPELVSFFIDNGANLDRKVDDLTALDLAIKVENKWMITKLIASGCNTEFFTQLVKRNQVDMESFKSLGQSIKELAELIRKNLDSEKQAIDFPIYYKAVLENYSPLILDKNKRNPCNRFIEFGKELNLISNDTKITPLQFKDLALKWKIFYGTSVFQVAVYFYYSILTFKEEGYSLENTLALIKNKLEIIGKIYLENVTKENNLRTLSF